MTKSDWGRVGGIIADQYRYLKRFLQDIVEGVTKGLGQIAARSRMYINSCQEAYWRASEVSKKVAGYTEKRRVVDPSIENCQDCLDLASKGWVPIGEKMPYPGDGKTQCLTNCGCTMEYRKNG